MKILMVYPEYPDTFWSFKHALKFVSKKAAFPPLGLLTVAAMLPGDFEVKLIDMNMSKLKDKDIKKADLIFISAMVVQRESAKKTIKRCKKLGATIVAGGPLFTTQYQDFACVDHFVLNEAEITLPLFLEDLKNGCARHIYTSDERPEIGSTPVPRWELVKMSKYSSMALQYSRGCPFDCEFCDIVVLNGRRPRTKSKEQVIRELEAIYKSGWREGVFIVDDNFIGNKKKLKAEILPAIIEWMQVRNNPFTFNTQTSINLAEDDDLIRLMVKANFSMVFIGIESPSAASLAECGKTQNKSQDLIPAIKKLQHYGLEVQGGFIIGFDSDTQSIFQEIINFIQKSGVVTAMVGLLNAPTGTRLYQRLKNENRLLGNFSGNNTDISINFVPKMKFDTLVAGYRRVVNTIYAPKQYYERITTFLKEYKPKPQRAARLKMMHYRALLKSFWILGVREKGRIYFWKLLAWTAFTRPRLIALSVTLSIYGFHFRKTADSYARSIDLTLGMAQ
ncbi:MAG: B12-binding domain-containing radical SAM protein [Dehalococcoidia bacterium]|nr:B12-binding domain-containing radical SAM protein [Dehalococcoidia bacterium]MDD5493221.1 B12-binding domain-containing radical SAM protein [Dehalococcoidia bacterium]